MLLASSTQWPEILLNIFQCTADFCPANSVGYPPSEKPCWQLAIWQWTGRSLTPREGFCSWVQTAWPTSTRAVPLPLFTANVNIQHVVTMCQALCSGLYKYSINCLQQRYEIGRITLIFKIRKRNLRSFGLCFSEQVVDLDFEPYRAICSLCDICK